MTQTGLPARCLREMDRMPDDMSAVAAQPIDPTPILGEWWNTNHTTWGIARAELSRRDGQLWMRVWAADPVGGPHDWGTAPVERLYTDGPFSDHLVGYVATFELGHARTRIEANMNYGVTVLAAFTTFTDGSGRANYMSREFFHRLSSAGLLRPAR